MRQIAENAGFDGAVVAGRLLEQKDESFGFDAQKAEYVNMIKAGVIDPTKVVRAALQGAVSVAGLLITTEAMVAEVTRQEWAARNAEWRRYELLARRVLVVLCVENPPPVLTAEQEAS